MTSAEAPAAHGAMRAASPRARTAVRIALVAAVVLIVALRLVALRSDPFTRLDWSAGQLTDEGFYTHNARNVALFGHARTDEFNNMLLAPLLHYAQVAVFQAFGVGSVQARLISVVCSLVTLLLFGAALNRLFGKRVAWTAVVILGLDHTNLLYNRMALMDTPAAMLATGAFYTFVRGAGAAEGRSRTGWLALSGALLGLTVVGRTLCMYLVPAPFLAVLLAGRSGRDRWRDALALALPLAGVLAVYVAVWYLPNRTELAAMTRYYRVNQIQPRSFAHLRANVLHAVIGDFRGVAPYLFRHTPVVFVLALLGFVFPRRLDAGDHRAGLTCLWWWLALGWLMLATISYSPSRYYVTTYPPVAALAALALWNLPAIRAALSAPTAGMRLARCALVWFLSYHAVEAAVHHGGLLPRAATEAVLYGFPTALAAAAALWPGRAEDRVARRPTATTVSAVCAGWLALNALWLGYWAGHLRYTQYEMSRWLAVNLPTNSVLIGDIAPGLSHDNRFMVVHVQDRLCNWRDPVERFAGRPEYIVILDGRWKEPYWRKRYPRLVAPARRVKLAWVMRWPVGVYAVPPQTR